MFMYVHHAEGLVDTKVWAQKRLLTKNGFFLKKSNFLLYSF
jgi:hypothetical protein